MTMALLVQAAISQLRERIGDPVKTWDSAHLAKAFFAGMEGDIRVVGRDTIVVTYYNAPNVEQLGSTTKTFPRNWQTKRSTRASLGCTTSNSTSASSD